MRKTIFANDEYYHVYNRGVDKRDVFMDGDDYLRFITSMKEFNRVDPIGSLYEKRMKFQKDSGSKSPNSKGLLEPKSELVEIICYCLNSNHYHFILKQKSERGIEKFMHKVSMGYTNYFNKRNNRSGSLFQGPFKSIHIDTNEYLLHLSAYVNRNDFIHGYDKIEWQYSSYLDYIGKRNGKLCNKEIILGQFKDAKEYEDFVKKTGDYFKDKKEMDGYLLE
ncbi:MAG: Transposase [Candidatus Moranbacteria bacterium GW2011_GWF1_34_10]|nr:MAG: Transposase [Candidatus Moranbacteria bacterium GW2011_GWF1_34_10]